MDTTGLIFRYKTHRSLSYEEKQARLHQHERIDTEPLPFLSTLRLNSTYLEMVGKFYEGKGLGTVVMAILMGMTLFATGLGLLGAFMAANDGEGLMAFLISIMTILIVGLFVVSLWTFRREAFRLTHYPIRLNRKLRKLYAIDPWSLDLVEADWDAMVFVIERCKRTGMAVKQWEIVGHVLAEDGETVRYTIPLSFHSADDDAVRRHWEYVRRFMEEGPQDPFDETPVCLPILEEKENFAFSYRMTVYHTGLPFLGLLMLPMQLPITLGRYVAMRTSQILRWPERIEAECAIEPGDPYAIDARDNPADFWKSTEKTRSELVAAGLLAR